VTNGGLIASEFNGQCAALSENLVKDLGRFRAGVPRDKNSRRKIGVQLRKHIR
jgi:hypothetical protein